MKLREYLIRRIVLQVLTIIGLLAITFFIANLKPGDPFMCKMKPEYSQSMEFYERMRHKWGLDKPLYVQFFLYLWNILRGDLGMSMFQMNTPVFQLIKSFFPATIELAIFSIIISIGVGIPLGIISAIKRNSVVDHISRVIAMSGVATPIFWSGLMALLIFYYWLGWLPGPGRIDMRLGPPVQITGLFTLDSLFTRDFPRLISSLKHLILPALTESFLTIALLARNVRSSMLEVLSQDYIKTARSKGLPERMVILKHALKNSLIPTVTIGGMMFGSMLTGSILVETVFAWPGIGLYYTRSIFNNDYPSILGLTILFGLIFSIVNMFIDFLYAFIDPQMRSDI